MYQYQNIKTIYNKLTETLEPLSNEEMILLAMHLGVLADMIHPLGKEFAMAMREAYSRYHELLNALKHRNVIPWGGGLEELMKVANKIDIQEEKVEDD